MKIFSDETPIYLQIKEEIEEAIIAERIAEGEQIQSIRALSAVYQVNPNTISNAYAELEASNVIFKKRGLGFYVTEGARKILIRERRYEFIKKDLITLVEKAKIVDIDLEMIVAELHKIYEREE